MNIPTKKKTQTGFMGQQWYVPLHRSQICQITFIFVPGHIRVRGKEKLDVLLSLTVREEGYAIDTANIILGIEDA